MSKPNVTRVQSATEWTASVHTLHMSKPNVTRVQSATERTARSVGGIPAAGAQISCAQIAPKPLKVPKRLKASKALKAPKSV